MLRICTICARGGSKGVKNKNIRELLGKPLIAHSILQARQTGLFQVIAVSSDSPDILQAASEYGADQLIKRPDEMARDTSPKLPVIQHCVREVEQSKGVLFDTIVDLDATSPLRTPEDIANVVGLLEQRGVSNVITGMPSRRSPYFNLVEINSDGYAELSKKLDKPVARRQDSPSCYDMNASVYAWKRDAFYTGSSVFHPDTLLYEMPEERSIDIDTPLDFEFVQFLAQKRGSLL